MERKLLLWLLINHKDSAEIGKEINALLAQAQALEEQSNFTLHKV